MLRHIGLGIEEPCSHFTWWRKTCETSCCPRCWLFGCLGLRFHLHIFPKEHQKERCGHYSVAALLLYFSWCASDYSVVGRISCHDSHDSIRTNVCQWYFWKIEAFPDCIFLKLRKEKGITLPNWRIMVLIWKNGKKKLRILLRTDIICGMIQVPHNWFFPYCREASW